MRAGCHKLEEDSDLHVKFHVVPEALHCAARRQRSMRLGRSLRAAAASRYLQGEEAKQARVVVALGRMHEECPWLQAFMHTA